tara:strand:+ start:63 stop:242 length:180 start_codon:yes stop_codon:yes gene_type:complete
MKLTNEEILSVADRLDEVIGDHFHDAVFDVYLQRDKVYLDEEIADEDIIKIKAELKRTL